LLPCRLVKRFVIALGIVLTLAALGVAGASLHATDHGTTVYCGDSFSDLAHGDALKTDNDNEMKYKLGGYGEPTDFVDKCESKKTIFKVLSIAVGIVGVGLLLGGAVIPSRKPEESPA
jgi:hypothetical protein